MKWSTSARVDFYLLKGKLGPAHRVSTGEYWVWVLCGLAFTRYCFTSRIRVRVRVNPHEPIVFYCLPLHEHVTLLHSYCVTIAQYTTSLRPPLCVLYTIQYWSWQYCVKANLRQGRYGPNMKPGTVCVCGMSGLRKGMNTTQHPTSPASRAGIDLPTNVQADSRAVSYVKSSTGHTHTQQQTNHSPHTHEHRASNGAKTTTLNSRSRRRRPEHASF